MSQHQTVSNCIFTHCYSENRTVTTAAISDEHIAPHSMFSGMGHKIVFCGMTIAVLKYTM